MAWDIYHDGVGVAYVVGGLSGGARADDTVKVEDFRRGLTLLKVWTYFFFFFFFGLPKKYLITFSNLWSYIFVKTLIRPHVPISHFTFIPLD